MHPFISRRLQLGLRRAECRLERRCFHTQSEHPRLSIGRDPEAAVFVDSRDSVHGLHSLRLHTPADGAGLQVIACKCSSPLPGFATA